MSTRPCIECGSSMARIRRGLCTRCYQAHYRDGSLATFPRLVPDDPVVCVCTDPLLDGLGECQTCHRKPERLLGVIGRAALEATGARLTPPSHPPPAA